MPEWIIFFISITIVLLLTTFTTGSSLAYSRKSTQLISNVITNKIPNCELVFAHDNHEKDKSEILLNHLVHNFDSISGFYLIDIGINESFSSFDIVHRLHVNTQCSNVIITIHEIPSPDLYEHLFDILTPRYGPLTRKDEDYYFFLSPEQITDQLIISKQFGNKIKYKIALSEGPTSVSFKTVHPYLNLGNPVIIALDELAQAPEPWTLPMDKIFPDMTTNHYGRAIKMTVPNCQWRFEMEWRDGRFHPKRGYYLYWLEEAMKKWNFTYDLFLSSLGGGTGAHLPNGTWMGAVGDVLYEEAEIGQVVGHIYSRHKYVQWSAPLSYEWMVFVCHKPKSYFSAQAIFWPFKWNTWVLFLACVIMGVGALKFVMKAGNEKVRQVWSFGRIYMYMYTSILEQDADSPSKIQYDPIRFFCAFWLLFALIVSTAYRAKLVSVIAFPISSWVPSTFEELAPSQFNMGLNVVGKGGAAYDLFRSSTSPTFQTIVAKMSIHPSALDCLTRAATGDFCCCMWQGISEFEGAKNVSDRFGQSPFQTSTSTTFFIDDGMVYQKRAIFRHHFDKTIWNAIQMGLVNRWIEMDWERVRKARGAWEKSVNKTSSVIQDNNGPKKLQVAHFVGGFVILGSGIGSGILSLGYEIFIFKLRKKGLSAMNCIRHRN